MKENNDIVDDTTVVEDENLASRWKRLFASLIDMIFMILGIISFVYFTGGLENASKGIEPTFLYSAATSLAGTLVFIVLNTKLLLTNGQTIGKKVLKIKIVDLNNAFPSKKNLAIHYLAYLGFPYLPGLMGLISVVDVLSVFRKDKRCLHNLLAETKVVDC